MCRLLRLLLREAKLARHETEGVGVKLAHGYNAQGTTECIRRMRIDGKIRGICRLEKRRVSGVDGDQRRPRQVFSLLPPPARSAQSLNLSDELLAPARCQAASRSSRAHCRCFAHSSRLIRL